MNIKKTLFALQLDLLLTAISHKELRYRGRKKKHYLYAGLLMAGSSLFSVNVQSATLTWNCAYDYWQHATCWDPSGTLPTNADTVNVYTVSGADTLLWFDSFTGNARALKLNINATTGTTVTLHQSGGTLSASNETIGSYGTGTFNQFGGTNTVTIGLTLGNSSTGNGSYDLSGTGALSADSETIGREGTGIFTQTGGTHTVTNNITLGALTGSDGRLFLSGGTLDVGGDIVGGAGMSWLNIDGGTLNVAGGDINVGTLHLGSATGSNGIYILSGTDTVTVTNEYIGYHGTGTFTQTGGTHKVKNITLGVLPGSDGSLFLSGGTLDVGGDIVGGDGASSLVIDGGTLNIVGGDINVDALILGSATGSNVNYTLTGTDTVTVVREYIGYLGTGTFTQTGGTNTITIALYLGDSSTGNGSYDLSGGALSAVYESIGYIGTGTFTQSGGTNTITNILRLGLNSTGNGSYNLSGGALSAGDETIGYSGTGTFTQSGGTNTVTSSLHLGSASMANGSYDLSGGALSAVYESIGYIGTGTFTQSGGTNTVTNGLILGSSGNGSYDLSGTGALSADSETIGYSGTGTFTQSGGTNTITNGLFLGSWGGNIYYLGNGSYNLSGTGALLAGTASIGYRGTGTFTQSGGTNTITSSLTLGEGATANGSYDLSGTGALSADSEVIGLDGTGLFTQTGGTHTVTNNITLGELTGSSGDLILSGGTLDVGGDIVGGNGVSRLDIDGGTLNVAGGDINVDTLHLGFATGSNGNYTVTGTDTVTVYNETIGHFATGTFTQSGGMNTVTNGLILGNSSTGNGSYDLSGTGALSANYETIGNGGTGAFTQSGGTNTVTNTLFLGLDGMGNGNYDLSGTGALSAFNENIGYGGTGTFTQSGGMNTITNTLTLGLNSTGNGSYNLSGGALSASTAHIGNSGIGSLNISNGRVASSTDAYLAYNSGASGTATLSDAGSAWNNSNNLYVGGSDLSAGGSGTLTVNSGATVDIGNILKVWSTGIVDLNGGTIITGSLINEGSFNFNAGALNIATDLIMDTTGPLGNSIVLNGLKALGVGGTTTLNGSGALTLDGGTFSTGYLVDNGGFSFNSGTFNLTSDDLVIGGGGLFGARVQLDFDQIMNVTNSVTVASDGVLSLNSGMLTGGVIINSGTVDLNGPISTLAEGVLLNKSLVTGDGRITAQLTNFTGSEVRVIGGDMLTFTAAGNTNQGSINLLGGTVEFTQDLINSMSGIISGSGNLIASGGLINEGIMALSGGTTGVAGDVNNSTGTIIVSGNSTATFFDDVVHNGTEFRVSDGSSAVFFGSVSGSSSYTGTGSLFFEGDLNPGSSPGLVDVEGDLNLGTGSRTLMEIAGLVRGDEYDAFDIGGNLFVDGELEVSLFDPGSGLFDPQLGDSFDLFSAETISGGFDLLTLALLGDDLGWQLDYLVDEIGSIDIARLSVISASTVPVPPAVWLFGSGLLGLVVVARRRHIK